MKKLMPMIAALLVATSAAALSQGSSQSSQQDEKNKQPLTSPPSGQQGARQQQGQRPLGPNAQQGQTQSGGQNASQTQPNGQGMQQGQQPNNQNQNIQQGQSNGQGTQQGEQSTRGAASLNQQQQTRVSSTISSQVSSHKVEPLRQVNFSLRVGTTVPTEVRFYPLPAEVVDIVPQYRGYSYFIANDQIVIVDPSTKEIAMLLPYEESAGASSTRASSEESRGATHRRTSRFSTEQRATIRKHVSEGQLAPRRETRSRTRYEIGEEVPDEVELREFPESVFNLIPSVRSYRYIERDEGGVVMVDPRRRRVYDVIE
jgi:Protein of unknown function (DUF1236)